MREAAPPAAGKVDMQAPPLRLKVPVDLRSYYEDKAAQLAPMTARMAVATAFLALGLWEWDWAVDPAAA